MFWHVKITFLYPDDPYASAQVHSEEPIFDKKILAGTASLLPVSGSATCRIRLEVLEELSQRPNGSIPGWAIVDYEHPVKLDPLTEMINLYVLHVGAAIVIAFAGITWIGIRIR